MCVYLYSYICVYIYKIILWFYDIKFIFWAKNRVYNSIQTLQL